MLFKSKRLEERQEGLYQLKELFNEKSRTLIIHYSCESFHTIHGFAPRITSISIRNLNTGQTKSYSIHLQAQFTGKDFRNLDTKDYNALEKEMLERFYEFVMTHGDCRWVHWNMRDSNYGFEAIANRYRILGGTPFFIEDDRKYDFSKILGKIYTHNYEYNKPDGRLLNLARRNHMNTRNALAGPEEAQAFEQMAYLDLHRSTLSKVDMIGHIVDRTYKNELKVLAKPAKVYGYTIPGIIEIIKNNWLLIMLWTIMTYLIGAASEPLVQKFFGTN